MDLTGGEGADVVVECVGGFAGVKSFEQTMQMVKRDGVVHLIALYQGQPLRLDSGLMMNKADDRRVLEVARRAERDGHAGHGEYADGRAYHRRHTLITHRYQWEQTPEAYHYLYENPNEALGVVIEWDR